MEIWKCIIRNAEISNFVVSTALLTQRTPVQGNSLGVDIYLYGSHFTLWSGKPKEAAQTAGRVFLECRSRRVRNEAIPPFFQSRPALKYPCVCSECMIQLTASSNKSTSTQISNFGLISCHMLRARPLTLYRRVGRVGPRLGVVSTISKSSQKSIYVVQDVHIVH